MKRTTETCLMCEKDNCDDCEPNFDCEECFGNGVTYSYYADHENKLVGSDWVYCSTCYPASKGFYENPLQRGEEVLSEEFHTLLKQGYREVN